MSLYGAQFCCAAGEPDPANAYYDLLYDVIPHTDRFGRLFETTWPVLTSKISVQSNLQLPEKKNSLVTPYVNDI